MVVFVCLCPPGCHESCAECGGPGLHDCASCSDPAALLRNGQCVPDCGAGFYSQYGVCYGKTDAHFLSRATIFKNKSSSGKVWAVYVTPPPVNG